MTVESNRLLLELERIRRDINREIINPEVPELSMEELRPMLTMVARVRMAYIREFLDIGRMTTSVPSNDQIEMLAGLRRSYEELVAAANAVETAIQRGYLDVNTARRE